MTSAQFNTLVYKFVRAVPPGRVITYGQLAILTGNPGWSRRVGRALRTAPTGVPCHRVVNHAGRLAPGWTEQRDLLRAEGISFLPNGHVNLSKHRISPMDL